MPFLNIKTLLFIFTSSMRMAVSLRASSVPGCVSNSFSSVFLIKKHFNVYVLKMIFYNRQIEVWPDDFLSKYMPNTIRIKQGTIIPCSKTWLALINSSALALSCSISYCVNEIHKIRLLI